MTSDKQKQALLKVVTKFQNLTPVQIENAALLIQHYRHYSEYEETIFKLIGGAPAASEFLEEPPQLSATEVTQLTNFRKSLAMNELKAKQSIKETSQVKVYSSRRQESHVQRRRVTGAGAGARGCGPHHPPVSRKSPARDESSFGCVVQTRQFLFVFSLRCVGFSRSSVLKFPFKGSW